MLKYSNFYFRWGDATLNTASDGAKISAINERQPMTRTGLMFARLYQKYMKIKVKGIQLKYMKYIP